jgi:hypothetical protein
MVMFPCLTRYPSFAKYLAFDIAIIVELCVFILINFKVIYIKYLLDHLHFCVFKFIRFNMVVELWVIFKALTR